MPGIRDNILPLAAALLLPLFSPARGEQPFSFAATPGQLPKSVVPRHYDLHLTPDIATRKVEGTARIDIAVGESQAEIVLNALELDIRAVTLAAAGTDPAPVEFRLDPDRQLVILSPRGGIRPGNYVLEFQYEGKIGDQAQGFFMDRYPTATGDKFLIGTQMEATDARRVFPCWDEPSFRATYDLTLVLPAHWAVSTNMPAVSERETADGKKETVFARTPNMPTYLVAVFAGEFDVLEEAHDGVQLRIFTTEGKRDSARYALEATKRILDYYHEYFDMRYPLPKLDQIGVPNAFSGFGAMENWGSISYIESILLYDPASSSQGTREDIFMTVAHEIAHQWFGNIVTMAWWDNLWLNEGFASWMEAKAADALNPEWSVWLRANAGKEAAMGLDARLSTHPIQQPVETEGQAFSAFDTISYEKGQAFIRMLETYLGEEDFRDGIRLYLRRHAYSNTTTADLWAALAEVSGKPVAAMAAGWTEQPGFPIVSLRATGTGESRRLVADQTRFTLGAPDSGGLLWQIPLSYAPVARPDAARVELMTGRTATLPWPADATAIKANVGNTGFYRVYYDDALRAALQEAVASLPEADQLNLLSDTWALVRAERETIPAYLEFARRLSDSRSEPVWSNLIGTLRAIDGYQEGLPGRRAYQRWAIGFLAPLAGRLGWDPVPGESPLTGSLRANLVEFLGVLGDEPTIAAANRKFRSYLENPSSLPADLRDPVLNIVGRYADRATYDLLHQLAQRALTTEEKRRAYGAMQSALDPDLAGETLAMTLGTEMSVAERNRNIQRVAVRGEQAELAWNYARAHFEELIRGITSFELYRYVPNIMNSFQDSARADELEAFMREHLPEEAFVNGARVAEAIRERAAFRQRALPALDTWIGEQAPAPER